MFSLQLKKGHRLIIYITENYGKDWWVSYSPSFNPTRIKLSIDPVRPDTIYAVFRYGGPEPLARSTDNGYSWELLSVASPEPSLYAVINDPVYPETLYVAGENGKVYCSTNAGIDWVERSNGLSNSTVEVLGVDPVNTAIIYAGTLNGIYKTTNYGVQWLPKNIGLGNDPPEELPEVRSLVIDPEEPTILYIGVYYSSAFEGRAYLSVDGAAKWFEISNNLEQMIPYDLLIDPAYADTTFAITDKGAYIYKPEFNKSLVSSSSQTTFANNGRKLLHIYATNELWVCYESGGVIYVVHSTDDGVTWSRKMEVGQGFAPAIATRDVPDYPPFVVWRADGELRDTIYFAGYIGGDKWSAPFPLVVSQSNIDFGPPSFVIGDYNIGHLAFSDGSNSYYTSFNVYNPGNPVTELIGQGINPCIGFMQTQEYPQVHCVLEYNGVIYYSARGENGWTDYYEVSRDEYISTTDSHHPSLVVEGDVVYVVWDGVLDGNRNIFWRHLTYFGEESFWSWIWSVCNTANPSSYPVLTTGYFCSWVEQQGNDYEIYYARYDPMLWCWRDQTNLSNSPGKISRFSHLAHKQTYEGTDIYFVWTENSVPPYDIRFEKITIGGGGGGSPEVLSGLPLYIAKSGEKEKSPFNIRRGGYVQYGNEAYKKVDYDNQYLEYRFGNLNSRKDYGLAFCVYQSGYNKLPLSIKVDGVQIGVVNIPQDSLIIRRRLLPVNLYEDSVIRIKVSGGPAICGSFVLYEYEGIKSKGGPQDKQVMEMGSGELTLEVNPNPFRNKLNIGYTIPEARYRMHDGVGQGVSLAIYDVSGKKVKSFNLESCILDHESSIVWFCDDDMGRRLPAGVYFVRFEAGDYRPIEKAILLR